MSIHDEIIVWREHLKKCRLEDEAKEKEMKTNGKKNNTRNAR